MIQLAKDLSLPLEAVTETFAILAKRGAGKTSTAVVMVEEMVTNGLPVSVIDPVGVWWGLRSSADGLGPGLPVVIFGGDHADLPLPEDAGALLADVVIDERIPAVLDLSSMSKSGQRRFVTGFLERLYHRNRDPLHLVVDEADLFAPQRGGADVARLLGAYEDVVRRGRARGLGCTSITQRPATLHKDILTQSEVLVALRMTGVRDVQAIDEWVRLHAEDDQAREVKASLAALPVGTAWVWSPGWLGILQQVQVRRRTTFDSSATPRAGETRVQPHRFAAVDLDRLRARLDTVTPHKASAGQSTGKLRAQIADLERRLAAAGEPAERLVEVPVVTAEQQAALAAAVVSYEATARTLADVMATYGGALAAVRPPTTASPAHPVHVVSPPRRRPPSAPAAASNGAQLSRAERAILGVLAQHPAGRTRIQLALLTGYSIKSSSLGNALGALRTAGLVTRGGEPIQATPAGVDLAAAGGDMEPLPTGRGLYDWWASRLSKAERAVLDVLAAAWPAELSRDEVADRTGYSGTSSSLGNALGRLRSLELVDGWAASDEFMEAVGR